jgi:hypothetical protein
MQVKYTVSPEKREQLNALSKEVYGASSRWCKLVDDGRLEVQTEEVTEVVPSEKEGEPDTTRQVKIPLRYHGNPKTLIRAKRRLSLAEVEAEMVERKRQLDEFKAAIAKAQEDQRKAKEQEQLEKNVAQHLTGSAL